jgi:hypothetical protein
MIVKGQVLQMVIELLPHSLGGDLSRYSKYFPLRKRKQSLKQCHDNKCHQDKPEVVLKKGFPASGING